MQLLRQRQGVARALELRARRAALAERLDLGRLAREIGDKATAAESVDAILSAVVAGAQPGDTVALLSNGAFGGILQRLLDALASKPTGRS